MRNHPPAKGFARQNGVDCGGGAAEPKKISRFTRDENPEDLIADLDILPLSWELTPVGGKPCLLSDWKNPEKSLPHAYLKKSILDGLDLISKKGKLYRGYASGYGLRTGEPSNGLLALDVDGASAHFLLEVLSGNDIPNTVSWSSGKPGRYQLLYQVPKSFRSQLREFTLLAIQELGNLKCETSEQLEFRYNGEQSVLPPGRHAETGKYYWINSPEHFSVAIAPQWLLDFVVAAAEAAKIKKAEAQAKAKAQAQAKIEAATKPSGPVTDWVSFAKYEVLPRFNNRPEQAFSWSGHNFKWYGTTLKGNPYNRSSQSGTSFQVRYDPKYGELCWQDKSSGVGGGIIQYRHMINGRSGYPKGIDYVEIVKQLASEVGIAIPECLESKANTKGILGTFLYEKVIPQLSVDQIFEGHQLTKIDENSWQSDDNFFVTLKDGRYRYCDTASGESGTEVDYVHRLWGGTGEVASKEWVTAVKQLATLAGLPLPPLPREVVALADDDGPQLLWPRLAFDAIPVREGFEDEDKRFNETIRREQRKLRSLTYPVAIELNQRYLPDDLHEKLPKSGLIGFACPKGGGKSVAIGNLIKIAKKLGIPIMSITPRIALGEEQALRWEITYISAYGKTLHQSGDTADEVLKLAKVKQGLAKELEILETELNFNPEELPLKTAELKRKVEECDQQIQNINNASLNTLGLCWDSLFRTAERKMASGLIVIDEAELGFSHLVEGKTCKRQRPLLLKLFNRHVKECLEGGGCVILSDADLTDLPIKYIQDILPTPVEPFIVRNSYKGQETSCTVNFYTGSRADIQNDLMLRIKAGETIYITADNRRHIESLERLIIAHFPEFCSFLDEEGNYTPEALEKKQPLIVRLDANTAGTDAGKAFIKRVNESLLEWNPRILLATPTLGVGVSINESTTKTLDNGKIAPFFDNVFGFCFGNIEPSQCRQALSRVRANVPRIVWAQKRGRVSNDEQSFFAQSFKKNLVRGNQDGLKIADIAASNLAESSEADDDEALFDEIIRLKEEAFDITSKSWNLPVVNLYAALKARRNYGIVNLQALLIEELEDEGHNVICLKVKSDPKILKDHKVFTEEIKVEEATAIASADPIQCLEDRTPVEEARHILNSAQATREERLSAQKTLLQDELPELEITPQYVYKAVVNDHREWLRSTRLYWYLSNFDKAKKEDKERWVNGFKNFAKGIPTFFDISTNAPKVVAIKESKIFDWVDLKDASKIYESNTPEAKKFVRDAFKAADKIKSSLGITISKKSQPVKLANKILKKLGLELINPNPKNKEAPAYLLDVEKLNDPDRHATLAAYSLKLGQMEEAEKQLLMDYQAFRKVKIVPKLESAEASAECVPAIASSADASAKRSSDVNDLLEDLNQGCDCFEAFDFLATTYSEDLISVEDVKDAIALANSAPLRLQLRAWFDEWQAKKLTLDT